MDTGFLNEALDINEAQFHYEEKEAYPGEIWSCYTTSHRRYYDYLILAQSTLYVTILKLTPVERCTPEQLTGEYVVSIEQYVTDCARLSHSYKKRLGRKIGEVSKEQMEDIRNKLAKVLDFDATIRADKKVYVPEKPAANLQVQNGDYKKLLSELEKERARAESYKEILLEMIRTKGGKDID